MWKAKNSSVGSSIPVAESQSAKPVSDRPPETGAGKSFRNFKFNTAAILQAMEAGFSS